MSSVSNNSLTIFSAFIISLLANFLLSSAGHPVPKLYILSFCFGSASDKLPISVSVNYCYTINQPNTWWHKMITIDYGTQIYRITVYILWSHLDGPEHLLPVVLILTGLSHIFGSHLALGCPKMVLARTIGIFSTWSLIPTKLAQACSDGMASIQERIGKDARPLEA